MIYSIVRHLLHEAENLNAYGLFSFFLFFAFFTGVLVWAFKLKKTDLTKMERLPLDGGEKNSNEKI